MPALPLSFLVARMHRLPFQISFLFIFFGDEVRPTRCAVTAAAAASGQAHYAVTKSRIGTQLNVDAACARRTVLHLVSSGNDSTDCTSGSACRHWPLGCSQTQLRGYSV